jgi:hypothetical protein
LGTAAAVAVARPPAVDAAFLEVLLPAFFFFSATYTPGSV